MTSSVHELLVILCSLIIYTNSQDPLLSIENGEIRGLYMQTRLNQQFAAFRGIPYAQSPTGNLRFVVSTLLIFKNHYYMSLQGSSAS